MKRLLLVTCYLGAALACLAQNPAADTLKSKLTRATSSYEKVDLLAKLSRTLMSVNPAEADKYAEQMTMEAEISRDRRLMVKALLVNGERFSYHSFRKESLEKSINYYTQALDLAKKNDLDKETAKAYIGLGLITAFVDVGYEKLLPLVRDAELRKEVETRIASLKK